MVAGNHKVGARKLFSLLCLQVELPDTLTIGAVATQGGRTTWVTKYKLGRSHDGITFEMVRHYVAIPKVMTQSHMHAYNAGYRPP